MKDNEETLEFKETPIDTSFCVLGKVLASERLIMQNLSVVFFLSLT